MAASGIPIALDALPDDPSTYTVPPITPGHTIEGTKGLEAMEQT
jgi:hypothetical protein